MWKKLSWKKSLLVIFKILGLFINIMAANNEYILLNWDKLRETMQRQ